MVPADLGEVDGHRSTYSHPLSPQSCSPFHTKVPSSQGRGYSTITSRVSSSSVQTMSLFPSLLVAIALSSFTALKDETLRDFGADSLASPSNRRRRSLDALLVPRITQASSRYGEARTGGIELERSAADEHLQDGCET